MHHIFSKKVILVLAFQFSLVLNAGDEKTKKHIKAIEKICEKIDCKKIFKPAVATKALKKCVLQSTECSLTGRTDVPQGEFGSSSRSIIGYVSKATATIAELVTYHHIAYNGVRNEWDVEKSKLLGVVPYYFNLNKNSGFTNFHRKDGVNVTYPYSAQIDSRDLMERGLLASFSGTKQEADETALAVCKVRLKKYLELSSNCKD